MGIFKKKAKIFNMSRKPNLKKKSLLEALFVESSKIETNKIFFFSQSTNTNPRAEGGETNTHGDRRGGCCGTIVAQPQY